MKKRILSIILVLTMLVPIVSVGAMAASSYSSDWKYWYQRQSGAILMRELSGSIVIAQAKLLAEAGIINPNSVNPDDYLEWCRAAGCYMTDRGIVERGATGSAMISYASNAGTAVNRVATISLSAMTAQDKVSAIKKLIGAGYFVILGNDKVHQAYVLRGESLSSGDVKISESSSAQNAGVIFTYTGTEGGGSSYEADYANAYVYSVGGSLSFNTAFFVSAAASNVTETSATLGSKCVYAGARPTAVGLYVGTSLLNMKKSSVVYYPDPARSDDPISISCDVSGLTSGTTYCYRFYAEIDGIEYTSDVYRFVTGGQAPADSGGFGGAFGGLFSNILNAFRDFFARIFAFLPFSW